MMEAPRSPGHVGYPPSVAADAHQGLSAVAYQSAELLFGRCEGQGSILTRSVETCTRAHQGSGKDDITQRAKVGNCPTHMAVPPTWRRHPDTWSANFTAIRSMEFSCGRTMAPGRSDILLQPSMRGTTGALPLLGIGLPNL